MFSVPRSLLLALLSTLLLACSGPAPDSAGAPSTPASPEINRVIVLGMIHSGHETSEVYSTARVKGVMRAIDPDYVLTEIPPDRMEEAMRSFTEEGVVTEARVTRFPEYKDALFPLIPEMNFEIIPTAGWTSEMANFRRDALQAISQDETRADDWAAYQAALTEMREAIGDKRDDPYFIHSDMTPLPRPATHLTPNCSPMISASATGKPSTPPITAISNAPSTTTQAKGRRS